MNLVQISKAVLSVTLLAPASARAQDGCDAGVLGQLSMPTVRSIQERAGIAYLAVGDMGLLTVDMHDASAPELLGSVVLPDQARGLVVSGSYAFVATRTTGLSVVNIADPTDPFRVSQHKDSNPFALDIAIDGTTVYMADRGLRIVDVSHPAAPVTLSRIYLAGEAYGVAVHDGIVLVAAKQGGVFLIDVLDPAAPLVLSNIVLDDIAWDVAVHGTVAY